MQENNIIDYWNRIESGDIIASKRIIQQYKKLIDEIKYPVDIKVYKDDGEEEIRTFKFSLDHAERPVKFIESFCKHSKGKWAGKPVMLELFQKAKFQAIYGFVDVDSNLRRYHECLTIEARKNGKSTETSGIALFSALGDNEQGAEVRSIASKKDQARIVFNEAKNMVSQSPQLSRYFKRRKSDLYVPVTFSSFEPLASDSNTLDGLNIHCGIIDELHSIKDRNLYDVIKQSMSAREQPLLYMITTSGFVRECIYDDMYEYAIKVLDGEVYDPRFLAFIYELDDVSEWTDFKMWEKANPGLGTIKSMQTLSEYVERAKVDNSFRATVFTKDFNIRNTQAGSWLSFSDINNDATFNLEDFRGTYAVGGTDLSSTTDLTCSTILMMKPNEETIYAHQMYFIPEELVEKKIKEDKIPYDKWVERGLIRLCKGNKVDYSDVTAWHLELLNQNDITVYWHGYDNWNSQYWIKEMEDIGFNMVVVRQMYSTFSQPMKELAAVMMAKNLNYNNNPIFKWCASNTSIKADENGNIRPVKGNNQRQRIDGLVSLLDAFVVLYNNMQDYQALID